MNNTANIEKRIQAALQMIAYCMEHGKKPDLHIRALAKLEQQVA